MKKRTVAVLAALLVFSNLVTYRVAGKNKWRAYTPPISSVTEKNDLKMREELVPFVEVLDILSKRYLEEVSVDELIEAAIRGMVEMLDDPQTSFLDETHWEEMMIKTTGSFSGIGIEITSSDGYITIIAPIKGTPGERAGLLSGDRIVEVDGRDIVGISTMEAVKLMRGPEGTRVTLKVLREGVGEPLSFEIVRGNIQLPSVFPTMLDGSIGYIEISTFDDHTGEDFRVALLELENQGMKGLILDLRDNPGGLLSEAIKIAQELLPAGPITYVVDRNGQILNTYRSYGVAKPYPIAVLVNGGSASASEIIAGAFQDSGAGVLIGTKTYGKATVQHLEELSNSTGLRYTVAKYRTPNGRDIHGAGLEPDYIVELPDVFFRGHHPITSDLRPGDESTGVLFLQKMLNRLGYSVNENGVFDATTERSVRAFQSAHGLAPSGVVNHETRARLQEVMEQELKEADTQKQKAIEVLQQKIAGQN